jgi:hypothetical protein
MGTDTFVSLSHYILNIQCTSVQQYKFYNDTLMQSHYSSSQTHTLQIC